MFKKVNKNTYKSKQFEQTSQTKENLSFSIVENVICHSKVVGSFLPLRLVYCIIALRAEKHLRLDGTRLKLNVDGRLRRLLYHDKRT